MTHLERLKFVVLKKKKRENEIEINFDRSRTCIWNGSVVSQSVTLLICLQNEKTAKQTSVNMNNKHIQRIGQYMLCDVLIIC